MVKASKEASEPTKEEIEQRRDQIAKRMLNTPPKPRKSDKSGDGRGEQPRPGTAQRDKAR